MKSFELSSSRNIKSFNLKLFFSSISPSTLRFLNNIVNTNEPTNAAVKMHQALFEDGNDDESGERNSSSNIEQPFSISRNLVQRKHDSNNMEMNNTFDVNSNKKKIDSVANVNSNRERKFNDFVTTTTTRKTIFNHVDKNNNNNSSTQSFFQFFKSIFKCCSNDDSQGKINEQTELNYPLNLHLRMNEIFSIHNSLCEVAECFNDLYSIGKGRKKKRKLKQGNDF